ncbi:MAG: hemerythrin domain-containing protein, partial [Candidatus Obscuribacterales bacterium]|nr:hemerythrin domain-containing protein [Candidatus Obscuribacterales bacterium]
MSFKELSDSIVAQHHSLLRRELPKISALIEQLSLDQTNACADFSATISEADKMFSKIRRKIEQHLHDEETVLFPMGAALQSGEEIPASDFDVMERLSEMEKEHDNCGNALIKLADMLNTLPQSKILQETLQQLKVVSTDMDIHVEKENTQVHPL